MDAGLVLSGWKTAPRTERLCGGVRRRREEKTYRNVRPTLAALD